MPAFNSTAPFGEIHNRHGERLDYSFHPGDGGQDLVVIGHGVTANKDRPFLVALAEACAAVGIAAVRFSFSGNGASAGEFAQSTITKEVEDLGVILDCVAGHERVDRIAYAGHSMGGAVGVLRAFQDPRLNALVSLAGMVHTKAFAERKFGELTPGQDFMWDKPDCPLSQAYMDDLRSIDSVVDRAESIQVPWLLVHGTGDTVVPPSDARDIHRASGKTKLVELPDVDHVFSGDEAMGAMAKTVVPWLRDAWPRRS